jgi:F-type H+-transporting ATPase subunit b
MRWVNFLILAFVLIKFSRAPIKKFLDGKHQDIADEIGGLEAEKEEALSQIDTYKNQLENSRKRLSDLKKRIVALGKKNKQLIIEAAEQESKILLKSAQQKINNRIVEARQELKSEIIDAAVALATKLLPEKITEEDNRKFIDAFMSSASSK